jgi:hypothetical protein
MMARAVRSADEEAAAVYLTGVGPIVAEGSTARQALVNGLAGLREAGTADGGAALAEAQGEVFRALRQRLGRLALPRMCGRCHAAVARWLELHEAACLTLIAGGPKALVKAGQLIADGQGPAQEFTAEYTRLAQLVGAPTGPETGEEPAVGPILTPTVDEATKIRPRRAQSVVAEPPTGSLRTPAAAGDQPVARRAPAPVAPAVEAAAVVEEDLAGSLEGSLQGEIEDAADVDDPAEQAVEELALALREELAAAALSPREQLNETAHRNGDAAWTALAVVAQARGHHPTGTLGAWLAAVEGVLAASAALTALIIAAETVVLAD